MPGKSADRKLVRRRAGDAPATTPEELARLRSLMDRPIDTSDSPEHEGPFRRIKRDAEGRLPEPLPELRESPIRRAILAQLDRHHVNRYQLWKKAQQRCARIPRSAVYEYLRGQRAIGVPYVEALLEAAGIALQPLTVTPITVKRSKTPPGGKVQDVVTRTGPAQKESKTKVQ